MLSVWLFLSARDGGSWAARRSQVDRVWKTLGLGVVSDRALVNFKSSAVDVVVWSGYMDSVARVSADTSHLL